jgi:8-oxo-dGTP pyrophosphatase MutT (NUDIX family)
VRPVASLRACVRNELAQFLAIFPTESVPLHALIEQLDDPTEDLAARTNMRGHVTSSVLVVDEFERALLILHRASGMWLPPGGHLEASDGEMRPCIFTSATREAREETGLSSIAPVRWLGSTNLVPIDIETHGIQASARRGEGSHVHHDFLYLATADAAEFLSPQEDEVAGARWLDLAEAGRTNIRLARVLARLEMIRGWSPPRAPCIDTPGVRANVVA